MVILLASALIITPLLIARLGKEGYGVWMLVGQIMAYLAILDLGVSSSIGRFVAKYNVGKDYANLSCCISSAIFLFFVSSALIVVVTLILWPNFSRFFHLSDEYFSIGRWLVLLTGFGVASVFPLKIGQGILEGTHSFHLVYLFRALGALAKLLLVVLFFGLLGHSSLLLLAAIAIAVAVLPNLLMCGTAFHRISNVSVGLSHVSLAGFREIWSLSLSALLGTIATLLFNQGQILGVGRIIGPETVTLYAVPIMMLTYGSMVTAYVAAAFKPMASHMHALGQKESLRKLNIEGVKVSLVICLFIAVAAIAFGYPFFRIWLPSKVLHLRDFTALSNVLTIMVIGFAVGAPQNVTAKMLSGTGRHWFVALTSLAASLIGFCLGIVLMFKTSLGLYGMAIGWAFVFFVKGVLVFPTSACRQLGIEPYSYIKQAYLPPIKAATILIATACIARAMFDVTSIAPLALCMAFSVGVYAVAVYFFCFNEEQRIQIRNMVNPLKA